MSIFIVCDHAGFELKNQIKIKLRKYNLVDLSPKYEEGDDYPLVAFDLAKKIESNDFAIALCGTGEGICMALNRFRAIRAATVHSQKTAKIVRKHNHANIICLPARSLTPEKAVLLIEVFLNTKIDTDLRHLRRVGELSQKGEGF